MVFFFFKQKTAYEMRISDWSSDVCSSDLFGFTTSFHILFPAFTIGLAAWLMVLEGLWLWGGRAVYLQLAKFWTKIFAVSFAMGVVSGIVLSYQFGTNWSGLSDSAGNILGPLLSYEVITALDRKSTRLNSSH